VTVDNGIWVRTLQRPYLSRIERVLVDLIGTEVRVSGPMIRRLVAQRGYGHERGRTYGMYKYRSMLNRPKPLGDLTGVGSASIPRAEARSRIASKVVDRLISIRIRRLRQGAWRP
jgi:hypothetical protein